MNPIRPASAPVSGPTSVRSIADEPVSDSSPVTTTPAAAPVDATETPNQARMRSAGRSVRPDATAAQRGVEAAVTVDEVKNGIETRNIRLNKLNKEVAELEAKLGTQLQNLSPALTKQERQAYADSFRQQHAHAYGEAREAAQDLASYVSKNLPRVQQAAPDLKNHPFPNAVAGMPHQMSTALGQAVDALDRHTRLAPKGSPELQRTLGELGQRFAAMAPAAGAGNPGAHGADHDGHGSAKLIAGAGDRTFATVARLSSRAAEIAERAAHGFGIAAGGLGALENIEKLASGHGRTEHAVGLAGNAAEIVGGALAIGGVAVGATIGVGGAIVALGAEAVSAYRDRQEYLRDTTTNLRGMGMDQNRAAALANANPAALRALAQQGWTPQQIADFTAAAPGMVKPHESQATAVANAARMFGLSPQQLIDLSRQMGNPGADVALNSLVRVISGNPGANRQLILRSMNQGFEANDHARALARLLPAS